MEADTQIWSSIFSPEQEKLLQQELQAVEDWAESNKMHFSENTMSKV